MCRQVEPRNPKLWCALGDVQQQEEHYRTAWEVSGHRSARAQRSLARAAIARQDYAAAAAAWAQALALSPLYPDAWFSAGYCYLKLGEQRKALQVRPLQTDRVGVMAPSQVCMVEVLASNTHMWCGAPESVETPQQTIGCCHQCNALASLVVPHLFALPLPVYPPLLRSALTAPPPPPARHSTSRPRPSPR